MAWMLLWRAQVAEQKLSQMKEDPKFETLKGKKAKNKHFYQGQIASARYFIETILPQTEGRMKSIEAFSKTMVDMPDPAFGG